MEAQLSLDSTEIESLAQQINEAISGVVNVDQILEDTEDDVAKAEALKKRADQVRQEAEQTLEHAETVTKSLSEAVEAQNQADIAIQSTQEDIDSARKDLKPVISCPSSALTSTIEALNAPELAKGLSNASGY